MQASYDQSRRPRSRSGPTGALAAPLYNASIPLPTTAIGAIPTSLIPGNINGVRPTSSYFQNAPTHRPSSVLPPGAMMPGPGRRRDHSAPGRPSTHYASPVRGATSPPLPAKPHAYSSWSSHTPISSPPLPPKIPSLPGQSPALSFYTASVATASPGQYTSTYTPTPMLYVPEGSLRAPSPSLPPRLPTPGPPQIRRELSSSQPPTPPAAHSPVLRPTPVHAGSSAVASPAVPPAGPIVEEPDQYDEEVLRRAMEASMHEQTSTQDLASREEEELAKALEASMRLDSSRQPEKPSIPIASSSSSSLYSRPQPIPPTASFQSGDKGPRPQSHTTTTTASNTSASSSSTTTPSSYERPSALHTPTTAPAVPPLTGKHAAPPLEVPQSAPATIGAAISEYPFPQTHINRADQMAADEALARRLALEDDAQSQDTTHSSTSTSSPTRSSLIQVTHSQPQSHNTSPRQSTIVPQRRSHSTSDLPSSGPSLASSSSQHPTVIEEDMPGPSVTAPRTANQFVEPELLMGLSFGFQPPPMSPHQVLMQDPIPNIISLPYGKAPPMHIQATSWKHLLRLLAKLSATRIEPALDALAVTKDPLKLRVVVQFIKNHHASDDWRTVIYLTVDHPPPPKLPNIARYTSGDPNQLPFSYSLSSKPALLRDGSDSALCKYFAIPPTTMLPLPGLPISLPNLALYLAQALEESRRAAAARDDLQGRLARLVDASYPMDAALDEDEDGPGGRRGLRNFAGRFMKRNKPQAKSRNADVYELVTPFVPDEWG
ncbi:hypothetical protein PENSPDRAFT_756985 [Peniophora sp. CONT]|nr:hypothetical protein PENSPDRAFT_756985 [Peniophora sp. CONT]